MKTNDLIAQLTQDVSPVRRLPSLRSRFALFLFLGASLATITLGYFGLRRDLSIAASTFLFQLETFGLLVLFISSTRLALVLSVPGERVSRVQWRCSPRALQIFPRNFCPIRWRDRETAFGT